MEKRVPKHKIILQDLPVQIKLIIVNELEFMYLRGTAG